jgi:hypothetical protein
MLAEMRHVQPFDHRVELHAQAGVKAGEDAGFGATVRTGGARDGIGNFGQVRVIRDEDLRETRGAQR